MTKHPYQMDQLEWIQYRRRQTLQQLRQSQQSMQDSVSRLTSAPERPGTSVGRLMQMFERGMMIYRGVRFGLRIGSSLSQAFARRRR